MEGRGVLAVAKIQPSEGFSLDLEKYPIIQASQDIKLC